MSTPVLEVRDLKVTFATPTGWVRAVRGVDLDVGVGEVVGIVGESGCGKSASVRALLGLAPGSAQVSGSLRYCGEPSDLVGALQPHAALVSQNPGASLNPVFTIGRQLGMVAGTDDPATLAALLERVGLASPEDALGAYPHEFSGGMQQRAVIALALAQNPAVLIADEPTTALDVTTQATVLDLLDRLRADEHLAVVIVSHDLGVIARLADRIAVMYAGRVVETGPTLRVLERPEHPYTKALMDARPGSSSDDGELATLAGHVPDGRTELHGCSFADRCAHVTPECRDEEPAFTPLRDGQSVACIRPGAWR